jgi:hypothetical protein
MSALPPSVALDSRNVMWLIAAMVFVSAPHLARLPEWVAVFWALVVGWRAWIAWSAQRFPPRWLNHALTIGASIATFLTYGLLFGRDAGTTLLVLMTAMKLLEMKTPREVIGTIYLGFFLVMTNFLYSQAIPLAIYMFVCVWLFVATLVGFHRKTSRAATLRERFAPSGALLAQALPLMLVFFVLFPRVQGPLWVLPQDARSGLTGLSDSMTPGNISKLIQSDAVAFRVQFEDRIPPYQTLYWRGPVMWLFDGKTWKVPEFAPIADIDYSHKAALTRYAITVEEWSARRDELTATWF